MVSRGVIGLGNGGWKMSEQLVTATIGEFAAIQSSSSVSDDGICVLEQHPVSLIHSTKYH